MLKQEIQRRISNIAVVNHVGAKQVELKALQQPLEIH